jgi:hypothetical protein
VGGCAPYFLTLNIALAAVARAALQEQSKAGRHRQHSIAARGGIARASVMQGRMRKMKTKKSIESRIIVDAVS